MTEKKRLDEYLFTVPVPPTTNDRVKFGKEHYYRKDKLSEYQVMVQKICMIERMKPLEGDVSMKVRWYRAQKSGDVPDRWKDLCDALEGFAYEDDKQIAIWHVERNDTDPKNARCVVTIEKVKV